MSNSSDSLEIYKTQLSCCKKHYGKQISVWTRVGLQELIVTANARSLRHFFDLRLDNRAQWEIRDLAVRMFELVYEVAPELFEDFKDRI